MINGLIILIIFLSLTFILRLFFLKINFLVEKKTSNSHRSLLNTKFKKVQCGGVLLFLFTSYNVISLDLILFVSLLLILILGVLSDIEFINSPNLRIIIQFFIITFLVTTSSTLVEETRIPFLDNLLNNNLFQIIFTIFCFLVLINGSNFIDGVNSLLIVYYIIVSFSILIIKDKLNISFFDDLFYVMIIGLFTVFIFNFFSKIIMGDSGAYFMGLLIGYFGIILSNSYISISPIFILNILWFPAFENLFSIIRKYYTKIVPSKPDNFHLHHLIYLKFKKKFKKNNYTNSLSGILINVYNVSAIFIATYFVSHTGYLSVILLFNIFVYILTYIILWKNLFPTK